MAALLKIFFQKLKQGFLDIKSIALVNPGALKTKK